MPIISQPAGRIENERPSHAAVFAFRSTSFLHRTLILITGSCRGGLMVIGLIRGCVSVANVLTGRQHYFITLTERSSRSILASTSG